MQKKLSPAMADAKLKTELHGKLVRHDGGFWTYPGCPIKPTPRHVGYDVPEWHVGLGTIDALIARNILRVTEVNKWRRPIEVMLTDDAILDALKEDEQPAPAPEPESTVAGYELLYRKGSDVMLETVFSNEDELRDRAAFLVESDITDKASMQMFVITRTPLTV